MATRSSGQIINRGPRTWVIRVYLGEDPVTKKRRYHNHTVHGTKKDAQAYLNATLREKDMGRFTEPSRLTLNQYLEKWLEDVARHKLRERTFRDYENNIRYYLRGTIGPCRLDRLKVLEIQDL